MAICEPRALDALVDDRKRDGVALGLGVVAHAVGVVSGRQQGPSQASEDAEHDMPVGDGVGADHPGGSVRTPHRAVLALGHTQAPGSRVADPYRRVQAVQRTSQPRLEKPQPWRSGR